ncbi:MAG TPA: succinylglutamate desuccinylase/aspartoacylase family protein [Thermoanaerobaculia bacterium]|nr:succinylglutamate desuccinylase/aspartoacylase family protein [Thermoanaerobaculia bacterium]
MPNRTAPEQAPLEIGNRRILAGAAAEVELPVARLATGTQVALTVAVLHGSRPGPRVWIDAALHGDELNGLAIIRQLLERLDSGRLAGTLYAVPVVNVFGLVQSSRYLPDRRDLNRAFPGSPRGSLAAQIAHLLLDQVVSRCDVGLDLHTGSDGRDNLAQIRCDLDDADTRSLARAFGAPMSVHGAAPRGSLRAAAATLGKRVLNYEAGEALRFDAAGIQTGVEGTLRVLQHLGMVRTPLPAPHGSRLESRRSSWSRAGRSGFCRLTVELGDRVAPHQVVARISGVLERNVAEVRARSAGMVIGVSRRALVHRGDALVHVAELAG